MCAPSGSLASFEIAVAGRGASFARLQDVGIHGQAHAAPRFPPLEAGFTEHAIEPFLLGLLFDEARAGNDHGPNRGGDFLPLGILGGQT